MYVILFSSREMSDLQPIPSVSERDSDLLRMSQENERVAALAKVTVPMCLKCNERKEGVSIFISGTWLRLCYACLECLQTDLQLSAKGVPFTRSIQNGSKCV